MSDIQFLDDLGAELERATRRSHGRQLPVGWGSLSARIGATGAVVVAVLALVLLSHHGTPPPATSASNRVGAAQLIKELAILRRPQTTADREVNFDSATPLENRVFGAPVRGLTRLVATVSGGRVFLIVRTPSGYTPGGLPPLWKPSLGDLIGIRYVGSEASDGKVVGPAAVLMDADDTVGLSGQYRIAIVPDGVARVRWTFPSSHGRPPTVIYPRVTNNVAIAPTPHGANPVPTGTWYAADGDVIHTSGRLLAAARAARVAALTRQLNQRSRLVTRDTRAANRSGPAFLAAFPVFGSKGAVRGANLFISRSTLPNLPLKLLDLVDPTRPPYPAPTEMREVLDSAIGLPFWVVPARTGLCIITTSQRGFADFSRVCDTDLARVLSNGLSATAAFLARPSTYRVGIVPRTTTAVRLPTTDGGTRSVRAHAGVYFTPARGLK
jgi:hypothetical protein